MESFGYEPLVAESFTDPEACHGTCYKASGWEAAPRANAENRALTDRPDR
jgi:hypothetical protein